MILGRVAKGYCKKKKKKKGVRIFGQIFWLGCLSVFKKVLVSGMGFILAHSVCKESFGQIWVKITKRLIRLEHFHFGTPVISHGVLFCSF